MSNLDKQITFRLIVDGKEAISTLNLTKGEFVETGASASKAVEQIKKSYQDLVTETQKYNQVNENSVSSLTTYISTQKISIDMIENTIRAIEQETSTLPVNSDAWKQKVVASANLKAALGGLINQQVAYGNTNQQTIPGVNSMRMAVQQFGYVLNDSQMFLVNARMGMMGIANNIPMIVELYNQARIAAGSNVSTTKLLTSAISGGGGLIIGINALMLLLNVLPGLFDNTTTSIEDQKESVKKLKDEYKELTREQLQNYIKTREEEKRQIESEHPETQIPAGRGQYAGTVLRDQTAEERFGSDKVHYEKLVLELKTLNEELATLGDIETVERRITSNTQRRKDVQETNLKQYKDVVVKIKEQNKDLADTKITTQMIRDELTKWIDADKKLTEQMEGRQKSDKTYHKFAEQHTRTLQIIAKEELKTLSIKEAATLGYIELNKELEDSEKLHAEVLQRIKGANNQRELEQANFEMDIVNIRLDALTDAMKKYETETEKAYTKARENRQKRLEDEEKFEEDKKKFFEQLPIQTAANEDDRAKVELDTEERLTLERATLFGASEEHLTNIKKYYSQQRLKIEELASTKSLELTSNTLGKAASLFGKHTAAYKILASAQALIDTYVAAESAYKSMVGIPVVGPALAVVAAATAVGIGLKNVAEINKINVEQPKGYATGGRLPKGKTGFIEGTHDELIAPEKDFKSIFNTYSGDLVKTALMEYRNYVTVNSSGSDLSGVNERLNNLDSTISKLNKHLENPLPPIITKGAIQEMYTLGMLAHRKGRMG